MSRIRHQEVFEITVTSRFWSPLNCGNRMGGGATSAPLGGRKKRSMEMSGDKVWVDGRMLKRPEASDVSLLTHSLHYGVGAFEGVRAYERAGGETCAFRLREHVERLFQSCKLVLLEPVVTVDQVIDGCLEVLRANSMKSAYLRPLVYLGAGSMGLLPVTNPVVTAVMAWEWGPYLGADGIEKGIRCKISSFSRHHLQSAFAQGKLTGQYVGSVAAKREVTLAGYDEAILLNTSGFVAEGSGENIFVVRRGELITPSVSTGILPGITRDTIMTLAREAGLVVREEQFTRDQLYLADEVFLTGTAAEVTPVREIDNRAIGNGAVGPVTSRLQARYFDAVRGTDSTHPQWLSLI